MSVRAAPASRPLADEGRADTASTRPASSKLLAALFSLGLIVLVFSPVVQNWKTPSRDDFPLSYYRMFSEDHEDTQRLTYLIGVDAAGGRHLLPYQFAASGGMNQARRQMNRLVNQGEAARLCRTVAGRVARSREPLPDLRTVEVTVGTFRMSTYFAGNQAPDAENVRARCSIEAARS